MIQYKGGDGSSKEKAVIILGAENEFEGVDAEYVWLEEKFGKQDINWELIFQELIVEESKEYDILRIKFSSGEITEFWFEISNFYGSE